MSSINKSALGELIARGGCGLLIFSIVLLILLSKCG